MTWVSRVMGVTYVAVKHDSSVTYTPSKGDTHVTLKRSSFLFKKRDCLAPVIHSALRSKTATRAPLRATMTRARSNHSTRSLLFGGSSRLTPRSLGAGNGRLLYPRHTPAGARAGALATRLCLYSTKLTRMLFGSEGVKIVTHSGRNARQHRF